MCIRDRICADGGCKMPGDVAKAFAAGADFVMLGGMFAGHTECMNDEQLKQLAQSDHNMVEYYGMSSKVAMDRYAGGVALHRASEGRVVKVEYKGDVKGTIQDVLGGLRSVSYTHLDVYKRQSPLYSTLTTRPSDARCSATPPA